MTSLKVKILSNVTVYPLPGSRKVIRDYTAGLTVRVTGYEYEQMQDHVEVLKDENDGDSGTAPGESDGPEEE